MKELPEKYYLDHFYELIHYISEVAGHLLAPENVHFINSFRMLSEDAQCMLVRICNRQSPFVRLHTLFYAEIKAPEAALKALRQAGFVQSLSERNWQAWLQILTKDELIKLFDEVACKPLPRSAKKGVWLEAAQQQLTFQSAAAEVRELFIEQAHAETLSYFLFLHFGHLRGRLNQFSMRDLGIMRTHRLSEQPKARFESLAEAKTAFAYARENAWLTQLSDDNLAAACQQITELEPPVGAHAIEEKNQFYNRLGKRMMAVDAELGLSMLACSEHPEAVEKRLRILYQQGQHDQVRQELERLVEDPPCEQLYIFASDFLARKYNQKRTSILTDMLRESGEPVALDEAFVNDVEDGFVQFYTRTGAMAFRTENSLWRALFALTLWEELFTAESGGVCNEFDRQPAILRQNVFYQQAGPAIEAKLQQLGSSGQWQRHVLQLATSQFGNVNGLFRWSAELLEKVQLLLRYAATENIAAMIRAMAQDYRNLNDGFPDIMVIEEGRLRFEEIKAPGDSLRRNQLISIQRLHRCGFDVRIRCAEWKLNPTQPYVVVDVETTGGNHAGHRITEVGMVKIINGEVVDSWHSLINPQRHIPRRITEITGIDNAMVASAPVFAEVSSAIHEFLREAIFVAHNVNFDYGFFRREFEKVGITWGAPKLCTVRLARKHFPGLASYSLGKLCAALGVELKRHHRALDDAAAAAEVLRLIQEKRPQCA